MPNTQPLTQFAHHARTKAYFYHPGHEIWNFVRKLESKIAASFFFKFGLFYGAEMSFLFMSSHFLTISRTFEKSWSQQLSSLPID